MARGRQAEVKACGEGDGHRGSGPGVTVLQTQLLTSEPLLARRALPVMYAVALDLRIFANNVSSDPVTIDETQTQDPSVAQFHVSFLRRVGDGLVASVWLDVDPGRSRAGSG